MAIVKKENRALRSKVDELTQVAEIARLQVENEALRKKVGGLNPSVSSGGAINFRMRTQGPFLFKEEALSILANADQLRQWIVEHDSDLKQGKDDARFQKPKTAPLRFGRGR